MELTPLQLAAACGHGDVIRTICGNPATLVNVADPMFSMTALHLAVHLGQIFAVEALCKDRRVEVDEKNVEGKTAMHVAVAHEYTGIVETILRLHPNIDLRIKDFDGNNVFHLAAYHPNVKIMTLLTNHASMVNLYCEYFDITKISSKNKPRTKKQIFEVITELSPRYNPFFKQFNINNRSPTTMAKRPRASWATRSSACRSAAQTSRRSWLARRPN